MNEEEEETGASSNADIEDNIVEGEKDERRNYMQWNGSSSSAEVEAAKMACAATNAQKEEKDAHRDLDEVCSRLKGLSTKMEDGEDACEGQYLGSASTVSLYSELSVVALIRIQ
jgi:hypothetical protein